jgi:Na+/melibiose symporter-like transporter
MSVQTSQKNLYAFPVLISYGFLALPLAFAGLPLYIHIPDFYTREMGLGVATAGAILMLLRFLDALQDPVIGYFSDRSARLQRLIMGFGLCALLCGMGALFHGPPSAIPVAYWFAGSVAVTSLGLSMTNINMIMMGSLWSGHDRIRARVSGLREGFSLVGMLLASMLPSILFLFMAKSVALEIFYIIFAVLLLCGAAAFVRFYKTLPQEHALRVRGAQNRRQTLPGAFFQKNAAFLLACFLTHIAASFPAVLFLYFVTDYLGLQSYAGLFLFLYFLSGAALMPLWLFLARRLDFRRSWLISIVSAIAAFVWALSLEPGSVIAFAVICVLSGAALGADLALPPVMMAKRLEHQNGTAYATQAYAILNLLPKIALALATGIAFFILGSLDFKPGGPNGDDALSLLVLLYALVPCAVKTVSGFIIFYFQNGDDDEHQKRSIGDGNNDGA